MYIEKSEEFDEDNGDSSGSRQRNSAQVEYIKKDKYHKHSAELAWFEEQSFYAIWEI